MPDDFDPSRLVALARARDQRRAYAKSLNDRYQELRAARQDVQRRMQLAKANAESHHGSTFGFAAQEAAKVLNAEFERLTADMGEAQAEVDAVVQEAGEAGQLLRACLDFAHRRGLPIPAQLAQEAAPKTFAPLGASAAGGAK